MNRIFKLRALGVMQALLVLTLLVGSTYALDPQTPPPPPIDQATMPPVPGPSRAVMQAAAADDYTVWRKDINSGCSFSDHNYTLDIPADPNDMTDISYTMTNWDVDYNDPQSCSGGPEVDLMYFNGHLLGQLTGANNSWSVNSWPLDKSQIVSGTNAIYIDTDAPGTGCWCVGVGWIEVKAKVGFKVKSRTPQPNDKNRDFHKDKLDLTVTFSKEYDTSTLTDSTFKLEYRDQTNTWQQVAGSFAQLAPTKFRFTPDADLKDGIRYRATVKSGASGVKAKDGGVLSSDSIWYFWTVPDLDLTDNFDYGSGSVCPPSTAPCAGLEVAAFQVSRNVTMVTGGKAGVARLYLRWKSHTDIYDRDQVKNLEVNASVQVDGQTLNQNQTVKRPDRYTASEKENAQNTINVYHTPNNAFDYIVEVTPHPQTNATPVVYTQTQILASSSYSPSINFNYYFVQDGDWAGGVPAAAQTDGVNLMTQGAQLITDLFPVLGTTFDQKGAHSIGYTRTVTTTDGTCGTVWTVNCPSTGNKVEYRCIFENLETLRGGKKFVAATTPGSVCPGATGLRLGNVFLHLSGNGGNYGTIAHETGHIYGLGHRDAPDGIEGFQVRTLTNRSYTENPTNVVSLMHRVVQPADKRWIHNDDYMTLIGTVTTTLALRTLTVEATGPYLIVSGYVNTDTNTAELLPAFLQEVPNTPPSPSGPCMVELLDGANNVLSSDYMTPIQEEIDESGVEKGAMASGEQRSSHLTQAAQPAYFTVSLPWDNAAQRIRVSCGGTVLLVQERSANAPTVDFIGLSDGDTLSGTYTLNWAGNDADGQTLYYQLQFSGDGGASWDPLIPLGTHTSYDLDTTLLPGGSNRQLRIMVTDGFDTAYAVRVVNIVNPLRVLGVLPPDGAVDVILNTTVSALFAADIATPTLSSSSFQVLKNGSTPINGTVSYNPYSRAAIFSPSEPLQPSTSYTARLAATIQDVNGNSLGSTYEWSFTTVPDTTPPQIVHTSPSDAQMDVPLNVLVQARFNEAINASTVTTASFQLLDESNNPVDGSVTYDTATQQALLIPAALLSPYTEYTARMTTDVTDAAGNPLEVTYEWWFTTGDQTVGDVQIMGNYDDQANDTNGDGFYDNLTLFVDVQVLSAGNYNLNGRLIDQFGTLIEWQTTGNRYLTQGVHTLSLVYSSVPIRSNGVDGPYVLDALIFYSVGNPSFFDLQYNAYQTFPYDVTQFYSILTLGGLPDQLLEWNTTRDNAFNLRDYTTHATLPLSDIVYSILVNTAPQVGVSIDADANIDINPAPNVEAESDVTIQARDLLGNRVTSTFRVSVQKPRASRLVTPDELTMGINQSLPISVTIYDQWDRLLTQPVTVTFETTLGTIEPLSQTTASGVATATLTSGNTPGTAFVTIRASDALAIVRVEITLIPPTTIEISGPVTGTVQAPYTFAAATNPLTATMPITYVWQATGQSPVTHVGGLDDTATFTWTAPGVQVITVTAANIAGAVSDSHIITISAPVTTCTLYPIGIYSKAILSATVGQKLVLNTSFGRHRFNWLSWTGDLRMGTLVNSLTPPGDSNTYINPYDMDDHVLSANDWVYGYLWGIPGNSAMRHALDSLKPLVITVPVWDRLGWHHGFTYRVVGFANIQINNYHLRDWVNWLSVTYLGKTNCP